MTPVNAPNAVSIDILILASTSLIAALIGAGAALLGTRLAQAKSDRRENLKALLEKDVRLLEPRRLVYREFHRAVSSLARLRRRILVHPGVGGVEEFQRVSELFPELYLALHRSFAEILMIAGLPVQRAARHAWEGVAMMEHGYFDNEHTSLWPAAIEWAETHLLTFLSNARQELGIAGPAAPVLGTFQEGRMEGGPEFNMSTEFAEFLSARAESP